MPRIRNAHPNLSRWLVLAGLILLAPSAHAQREADSLSTSIRKATARVTPAVVSIRPMGIVAPIVPPFVRFGRPPFGGVPVERLPSGSGLIVDAKRGLVATSAAVLRGSLQFEIVLPDGTIRQTQRVVLADPRTDLALIEFDPRGVELVQAEWGVSQDLQLGDRVLAVGRSAQGMIFASAGIVSMAIQPDEAGSELDPIQTDALITSENAGGPLINLEGQVVGISQVRSDLLGREAREGFPTAIPSAQVRVALSELEVGGKVRHGYLGVILGSPEHVPGEPIRRIAGAVVTGVAPNSPAAEAGIAAGDRILSINGRSVRGAASVSRAVEVVPVGSELTLVIDRQGKQIEIKARSQPRPDGPQPPAPNPGLAPLNEKTEPPETEKKQKEHSDLPQALPEGPQPEPL